MQQSLRQQRQGVTRWIRFAVCAVLCTLGWAPARAQQPEATGPDHDALRSLKALYEKAVNENQLDLLSAQLDPTFSGVMVTGERVGSFAEMRAYWEKIRGLMGSGGRYTVAVKPDVSVILGDVALAKGTTDDKVVTGAGKEYVFSTEWTALLKKQNAQWKLLRVHGSMDSIGNPFVLSAIQSAGVFAGAIAGVVGIVVGYLLRALLGRRRQRA